MILLDEITQLGQFIRVRIEKADRASGLAHDHYLAAGLELKKAKTLIQKTPELTWPQFVKMHCGIGQSRADELIALADGKITYEELRKRKRKSSAATYKKYRDAAS